VPQFQVLRPAFQAASCGVILLFGSWRTAAVGGTSGRWRIAGSV